MTFEEWWSDYKLSGFSPDWPKAVEDSWEEAKEQYKPKWVRFSEQQPKLDQEVIIRSRSGYTSIAQYMNNGNNELIWSTDAGNYPPKDSDKWMSIPE